MKNILLFSFILLGLQSCVIKEEFTINDTNQVEYKHILNATNAKMYLPESFFENEVDFLNSDQIAELSKGMIVQQFYDFLKEQDKGRHELTQIEDYFKKNNAKFQKIKNDSLMFDFYNLSFETSSKTTISNVDSRSNELNSFISDLTKMSNDGMSLNFIDNKKTIANQTLTVDLNKKSFENFMLVFSTFFNGEEDNLGYLKKMNFLSYQVKVNTPKPIKSTNIKGNSFSYDRKSVTGNYSFEDVLNNKIAQIKVVYE